MKRPSFQFYPADWRSNAKLRRCSEAARGAWMDVLCVLHDSDEYGVVRYPLTELARAAGVPLRLLKELAAKDVLKGADANSPAYVFAPFHAGKAGQEVTLVEASDGPCWYSTRFVRDEHVRQKRGGGTRFTEENQPPRERAAATEGTERARLRAAVLSKTDGKCHHCGLLLVGAWEIDHLIPRAKGGSNLFANLVPACVRCNQDKADSMPDDWSPDRPPTRRVGDGKGDGASSALASASASAKSETPEAVKHTPPAADGDGNIYALTGTFEGHGDIPAQTPNPVARFAIALTNAGFQATSLNPKLIAYVEGGGSVEHLLAVAAMPECKGTTAGYVLGFAIRELTAPKPSLPATVQTRNQSAAAEWLAQEAQ